MTHYELFFFFAAGFKPKDISRIYGYNAATSYRAYSNYRKAQRIAMDIIRHTNSLSFKREKEVNDPDQ